MNVDLVAGLVDLAGTKPGRLVESASLGTLFLTTLAGAALVLFVTTVLGRVGRGVGFVVWAVARATGLLVPELFRAGLTLVGRALTARNVAVWPPAVAVGVLFGTLPIVRIGDLL